MTTMFFIWIWMSIIPVSVRPVFGSILWDKILFSIVTLGVSELAMVVTVLHWDKILFPGNGSHTVSHSVEVLFALLGMVKQLTSIVPRI
jgi:hypothetical protein